MAVWRRPFAPARRCCSAVRRTTRGWRRPHRARDLVEQVLHLPFDDLDDSQRRRLNTAISRLRERLGDDPRQPRYLHTEPGGGYRLVLHASQE